MNKSVILTPAHIERLKSGVLPDREVPGLSIIVSSPARKQWRFKRTVAGTKTAVELILGQFPDFSIDEAREWAAPLSKAVARGEDPRETKRAEEAKKMPVASAHAIYLAAMHRGDRKKLKPRTLADKDVIYTRDIEPRIGSKVLAELSEDECWDAVYDKAKASKHRANKMAGELSCFLKWCSGREGRMAGIMLKAHPAPTLNSNWFDTGPKANTRFLDDEEIGWLFRALVEEELTYRRGFILLLLTAARRNELFGAPACEVEQGVWTLPEERSKNGEANIVALGPWGRQLIQTNYNWLFPSPRLDGPQLYGWFKARDRIHARMEQYAGRTVPRWHFHDFRRTFRSNSRRLGIDRDIAELMLNHKRKGMEAKDGDAVVDEREHRNFVANAPLEEAGAPIILNHERERAGGLSRREENAVVTVLPAQRRRYGVDPGSPIGVGVGNHSSPPVGIGDSDEARRFDRAALGAHERYVRRDAARLPDRCPLGAVGSGEIRRFAVADAPEPDLLSRTGISLEQDQHIGAGPLGNRRQLVRSAGRGTAGDATSVGADHGQLGYARGLIYLGMAASRQGNPAVLSG